MKYDKSIATVPQRTTCQSKKLISYLSDELCKHKNEKKKLKIHEHYKRKVRGNIINAMRNQFQLKKKPLKKSFL